MNKRIFLYTFLVFISANSLFSATANWTGLGMADVWEDADNWSTPAVPGASDDVIINGLFTVMLSSNATVESVFLASGADLTIAATYTLNVEDNNGNDGVDLDGAGTILTVHGTLNSSGHTGNGIEVNEGTFLTVTATGTISVSDVGKDGIEIENDFTNAGSVTVTDPGPGTRYGISARGAGASGSKSLTNSGTLTVSGGVNAIDANGAWLITNTGTMTLTGASVALVDSGSDIDNLGTFKGAGIVENGNNGDFSFQPGSTLAPGTSVGKLTFRDNIDFTDVIFDIEIDGLASYDQVAVGPRLESPPADITLSETILNLSGSYMPVGSEVFMILEKVEPGAIDGTFKNLPEGSTIPFNGANLIISYTGGDGNDMTASFDSPLPIELINFSARAMENEVVLSWATATEINNDFFTIERSHDGRNFEEIATIFGNGNTTELTNYTKVDENPRNGLNYYRLKQTDYDQQFSYSDIKTVQFGKDKTIKVYPTFVENELSIETGNDIDGDLTIIIRDITGREYNSYIIPSKSNRTDLSLNGLIPGSYFVIIYNNEKIETHKIIKM